jgi:hypothetical protein
LVPVQLCSRRPSGIGRVAPEALFNRARTEQNTKLYRSYLNEPGFAVSRPRGKSPQQAALFTRSPTRGELLCQAFEVYQQLMPSHGISFEHAVFLVTALARGDELALGNCPGCGALILLDRAAVDPANCLHCKDRVAGPLARLSG